MLADERVYLNACKCSGSCFTILKDFQIAWVQHICLALLWYVILSCSLAVDLHSVLLRLWGATRQCAEPRNPFSCASLAKECSSVPTRLWFKEMSFAGASYIYSQNHSHSTAKHVRAKYPTRDIATRSKLAGCDFRLKKEWLRAEEETHTLIWESNSQSWDRHLRHKVRKRTSWFRKVLGPSWWIRAFVPPAPFQIHNIMRRINVLTAESMASFCASHLPPIEQWKSEKSD